ncbi:SAF domain-containing protein [Actinoallomurus rhizosphaericola]|uniref:SAF domain-containing protein n=1 Tax=Actinoallomurus rhizosphaericola TaxID=2952536 RepID=UPI002092E4EA|nr:SAF domain-containing protein [Actinoallomurus rhizosphaericola]MCO5999772.1 SAF domain-containing protein [Actinoallomurus rhizosphaericola]
MAILALGVLANVYLFRASSDRTSVVRVARDVAVGQPITRADLDTAVVALGPGVRAIPGGQLGEVVGRRAAVGLRAGTLLTASQVTAQLTPGPGQALVAVPFKPSQLPPRGLEPGTQVRIVATSGGQDDAASPAGQGGSSGPTSGKDVAGAVDAVGGPDADGAVTVSLLVADGDASAVARLAAAGRVALVVTSRAGS